MTIEINRGKSPFIFRQNPFNARIIDRRQNKHGARWEFYDSFATPDEARTALLKLETEQSTKEQP